MLILMQRLEYKLLQLLIKLVSLPYQYVVILDQIKGAIARVPRTRSVICNYLNTSSYYSNWK